MVPSSDATDLCPVGQAPIGETIRVKSALADMLACQVDIAPIVRHVKLVVGSQATKINALTTDNAMAVRPTKLGQEVQLQTEAVVTVRHVAIISGHKLHALSRQRLSAALAPISLPSITKQGIASQAPRLKRGMTDRLHDARPAQETRMRLAAVARQQIESAQIVEPVLVMSIKAETADREVLRTTEFVRHAAVSLWQVALAPNARALTHVFWPRAMNQRISGGISSVS
jgi:hypothetical protein